CDTSNGMCSPMGVPLCTGAASHGCDIDPCPAGESCDSTRTPPICQQATNPVPVPIGDPCASSGECGTGGICIPEYQTGPTGWAGGYCTQSCGAGQGPCPS